MKKIEWKIMLSENNKIATMEHAIGIPQDSVESQLLIIGILENIKQRHLSKLATLFEKSAKKGEDL